MKSPALKKVLFKNIFYYFACASVICCLTVLFISYYGYQVISKQSNAEIALNLDIALKNEHQVMEGTLKSFGDWTQSYHNIVSSYNEEWISENIADDLRKHFQMDLIAVVDEASSYKIHIFLSNRSVVQPKYKDQWESFILQQAVKKPGPIYVRIDDQLYMMAIKPITDLDGKSTGKALIAGKIVSNFFIQKISASYMINNLSFVQKTQGDTLKNRPYYTLEYGDKTEGYLIWGEPELAATLLKNLLPISMISIFLLCGIALIILRHLSKTALGYDQVIKNLLSATSVVTESKNQAEQSSQAKTRFLHNISHEVRTPMNGIMGMISLLKETDLDDVQTSYVETMQISADSLITMLDSIMDFNNIETGQMALNLAPVNMKKLVSDVEGLLRPIAFQKKIKFECFYSETTPVMVKADAQKIRQVLFHLVTNALKFTTKGSVRINVVSAVQDNGNIEMIFQVIDTGIGIPDGIRQTLFDDFFQVDSTVTRQFDGAGLGLSIVKNMLNIMKGKLGVESKLGQGSVFWFSLYLEALPDVQVKPVNEVGIPAFSLLLMEDNAVNKEISLTLFGKIGANVEVATSFEEVKAKLSLSAQNYDALVLRVNANNPVHREHIQFIREFEFFKNKPIIGLLSEGESPDLSLSQMGLDQAIPQPLTVRKIQMAFHELISAGSLSV